MNRRLSTFCLSTRSPGAGLLHAAIACGVAGLLLPPMAHAQTARPAAGSAAVVAPAIPAPKPISNDEKTSAAPNTAAIDKFVKDDVARLASDDAEACSSARGDLIAGSVSAKPDQPASAAYVGAYLSALSNELRPVLSRKPSVRVKVNVAIVIAKVAENVKVVLPPGLQLQALIIALLRDDNDAVALWGMKAAAAALSAPNQGAPSSDLIKEIIPTVKKHNLSGPITDEAYNALQDPSPLVIQTLTNLYAMRIAAYKDGVPQEPAVDRKASGRLTTQAGMWAKMNATEQARVMNTIADALAAAAKALQDKDTLESPEQVHLLLTSTCEAVMVAASGLNQPELSAQAARGAKVGTNAPPAVVVQLIDPLVDAIRKAFPQAAAAGGTKPPTKP